ncbi:cytochrome c551 [Sporosarcina sp. FSL W7-1349]|uniref:cytochrome c551 n=1 Tax=Sporosarcina sp. FSL W7-1349 TaxID=2921561 RepID=UPI0030F5B652
MKKKLLAMMLGAGLVLGACGGGNDDNAGDTNNDANTGTSGGGETASADAEALYSKSCIGCHGGNLEGASGPKLSDVGSRLSEEEIHTIILEGKGNMPPGLLQGEEADAVAKWLSEKK